MESNGQNYGESNEDGDPLSYSGRNGRSSGDRNSDSNR
jgi:hypothetical protein